MSVDEDIVWPVQGWEEEDPSHNCSFPDARLLGLTVEYWNCEDKTPMSSKWCLLDRLGRRLTGRVVDLVVEELRFAD